MFFILGFTFFSSLFTLSLRTSVTCPRRHPLLVGVVCALIPATQYTIWNLYSPSLSFSMSVHFQAAITWRQESMTPHSLYRQVVFLLSLTLHYSCLLFCLLFLLPPKVKVLASTDVSPVVANFVFCSLCPMCGPISIEMDVLSPVLCLSPLFKNQMNRFWA